MPWVKGQSGNPGGRPKLDARVSALAKKESPAIFKKLVRIANGKPATEKGETPSNTEILRAMDMVFDRADPVAPAVKFGDQLFHQGGFTAVRLADEGYCLGCH